MEKIQEADADLEGTQKMEKDIEHLKQKLMKKRGIDFEWKIQPILNPNETIEDDIDEFCEKYTTVPELKNSPDFAWHQKSPDKGIKKKQDLLSPEDK